MSYTKGKWTVELMGEAGNQNERLIIGHPNPKDFNIIRSIGKTFDRGEENIANAERICQCVNSWDDLVAQRDELLKAAKDAISALNHLPPDSGPIRKRAGECINRLRVAIAKAESA